MGPAHERVIEADVTRVAASDEQMVLAQLDAPAALVLRRQHDELRDAADRRVHICLRGTMRWHAVYLA